MLIRGNLFAESPIYRGNMRKTLFTRDGDGTQRLVSLAGEIDGTAQALMDAFIGASRNKRNLGLLNQLWQRLFGDPLSPHLITQVECHLRKECYPKDHFFDLRMGLKLDEDRGAAQAGGNYKMETLFRHSVFELRMHVSDTALRQGDNAARLFFLLEELKAGRFWFGAGKSKGLGRCRMELETPLPEPPKTPKVSASANHLTLNLSFTGENPVLVGWNWGKVDPATPAFAAVEGRLLVEAMRNIPEPVRERLAMAIGGPILDTGAWKGKLAETLPRAIAAWLKESGSITRTIWRFPSAAVLKLTKGKFPLSKKVFAQLSPLLDEDFSTREEAENAFNQLLGVQDAKKAKRVLKVLESVRKTNEGFPFERWDELTEGLGLTREAGEGIAKQMEAPLEFERGIGAACRQAALPRLFQQVDQQIHLLQSDAWLDAEVITRREHLHIKKMLSNREIDEHQWSDPRAVPPGVREASWREFLNDHRRVQYHHMLNLSNLRKSIVNDENIIAFLTAYRSRTQQELSQPDHIDFRAGGRGNREISQKYGKPYDTVFMRMLSWNPVTPGGDGHWEVYIPGGTLKGAFRTHATRILRAMWGESRQTVETLNTLFGTQGQRGMLFFSDAYLATPEVPEEIWCSMDAVRMDPQTGKPVEEAKADYLFAFGDKLEFRLRIDLQDIGTQDFEALSVFSLLLRDFQHGDIPLGGEKTSGFGWVSGCLDEIRWLSSGTEAVGQKLFGKQAFKPEGIWQSLTLGQQEAQEAMKALAGLKSTGKGPHQSPPKAQEGFISHRAFGGYCGTLHLDAKVLTPLHIRESGEPSFQAQIGEERVNGWDFFSLASPKAALRPEIKRYALPSKSLRGMVRHLYSITSGSEDSSPDLSRLNAADRLFGWVGNGPNQALASRLSFSFGTFKAPELGWIKLDYPYGEWQYRNKAWHRMPQGSVTPIKLAGRWRIFPQAQPAPCVTRLDDFTPNTEQAEYFRAILPDTCCHFTIRFWNLEREEMERLLWCLVLEDGLAHKVGKGRQVGLGSLRLQIMPESFFIDLAARYSGRPEKIWRQPVKRQSWHNPQVIRYRVELTRLLNANAL